MFHPLAETASSPSQKSALPSPPLSPVLSPSQQNVNVTPTRLERALTISSSEGEDPYLLRSRVQSPETIALLRHRRIEKRSVGYEHGEGSSWVPKVFIPERLIQRGQNKKLEDFYSNQNSHIESLLKTIDAHAQEAEDIQNENKVRISIAVNGSLIANVCLMILQIYAAASSLSLSFFATAIDAVFDPCANLVLNWAHRKAEKVDVNKYPAGGGRFETIGNIVYSGVMGMVSLILIVESIQAIVQQRQDNHFHLPAVIAVAIAFITKFILFLWCTPLKDKNSQVEVLWEDHRNDLFINGLGILTSSAGAKIKWWIDPMGAIVISCLLIYLWSDTCITHFAHLSGRSAPTSFLQLVIYKTVTFSPLIKQIDSCKAYHSGENYVVEVDVVMDGETPLWQAHDCAQALQDKLEELPRVERAYVHIDHETSHKPEHNKFK